HVQEDARIIELRQRAVGVERSLLADRVPILGQALEAIEAMKLGGGIWRGVRPSSERSAAVDAEFQINDLGRQRNGSRGRGEDRRAWEHAARWRNRGISAIGRPRGS